jgi:signal transduction histidine kinase
LAAVLAVYLLCWVAAFFVTAWVLARLGLSPAPLVREVATALGGLVFMACPVAVLSVARQPRDRALFQSITTVLGRIGRGDFSARVERLRVDHPFNHFADTINSMAVALDRMERLRQEFVSNVSHELQSPLTSIGGFARLLRDADPGPAERRRYLDVILAETERLSRLSDHLLRLAALEAEPPGANGRPYRLDRQLRRVLLAAEPQWSGKRLTVHVKLAPVTIAADEALLEQVWVNLLHNAVKFTAEGGSVAVRLRAQGGAAHVEVEDTGIGIAPEDQPRVFERFFKADRARGREAGGSGLGLALVRRIVELHGGAAGLRSAPGVGTTFSVTLPLGPPAPAAHGAGAADREQRGPDGTRGPD